MLIDLRNATVEEFTTALFDHTPREELEDKPWYFADDLHFVVEPERQVANMTAVLEHAGNLIDRYSSPQIEEGLWCMIGGCWFDEFFGHAWNPSIALEPRLAAIDSIYFLYDQLLAARPFESIHFRHPDLLPRRFANIDYMVTDLMLLGRGRDRPTADARRLRDACLRVFVRLLHHPAPVAQYSALHGLGHLNRAKGRAEIALYIAQHDDLSEDQLEYAHDAMRGDVL
ncbi:MAG TPA: hypothetical protein VF118_00605 [Gemmatimonadaceae bacterium]